MKLNSLTTGALLSIMVTALVYFAGVGHANAQSYSPSLSSVRSFVPLLSTVEQYIGPILPPDGLGNSFRSEIGTGVAAASLQNAVLSGSRSGAVELRKAAGLDEQPLRFDVFADLRIWRLGLRANYWNFDARSKHRNIARFDFSGLKLGGDVDLVCHNWLTAGVSTDFYLFDPRFQGRLHFALPGETYTLDVKGERPITVGGYIRYVPPEILNWPLHFEGFLKASVNSTALTSYGARLVFRPQIYRFDVACRLLAEKTWVQFSAEPDTQILGQVRPPDEEWSLDMELNVFGIDLAVYF